jgi:glucose/arabinose dehydrogenase
MRSNSYRFLLFLILLLACLASTRLSPSAAFDAGSSWLANSEVDRAGDAGIEQAQVTEPLLPVSYFPLILLDDLDGELILGLSPFAAGLNDPVGIVQAGDDRLFVLERAGKVRIIRPDGTVLPTPFLDITGRVGASTSEEGLLGIAFHPDYANNGFFFLNYTNTTAAIRRTRISRFSVTTDPDIADPTSEEILLTVTQPFQNHNAGYIMFGPDGYLYLPLGDGGGGGDTQNNAQNPASLLGKVSRLDIDSGPGLAPDCVGLGSGDYTIPADNPFVDGPGNSCDEIWLSGFRNPWQSTFDSLTGDLYIGDVGQGLWEEVSFEPAGSAGGANFGWRCYEGNHPYNTAGCGPMGQYVFPIFEYGHTGGNCSVIGGYVYRGKANPDMAGHYFLTDYCTGIYWDLYRDDSGVWMATEHNNLQTFGFSAFGEAVNGELFVANKSNGIIYHLEDKAPVPITKAQTP